MSFNPTPCCSNQCRDSEQLVVSRTPAPGTATGSPSVIANTATITFRRKQGLRSFIVLNNGVRVPGTVSPAPGSAGTSFTFTPTSPVNLGKMQAFVITKDVRRGCTVKTQWFWFAGL